MGSLASSRATLEAIRLPGNPLPSSKYEPCSVDAVQVVFGGTLTSSIMAVGSVVDVPEVVVDGSCELRNNVMLLPVLSMEPVKVVCFTVVCVENTSPKDTVIPQLLSTVYVPTNVFSDPPTVCEAKMLPAPSK